MSRLELGILHLIDSGGPGGAETVFATREPGLRRRMAAAGRVAAAERYSVSPMLDRYEAPYRTCLRGRSADQYAPGMAGAHSGH